MDILGAPVGDTKHCKSWIIDKVNRKGTPVLKKLVELEDPQASFPILQHCQSFCRMVFFIRTTPPPQSFKATKKYDKLVFETFEGILGQPLPGISLSCAQLV